MPLHPCCAVALLTVMLPLVACQQQSVPPVPSATAVAVAPAQVTTFASEDTSVPDAAATFAGSAVAAKAPVAPVRTNAALTVTQESQAMPLAGQANDHSSPLAASAPSRTPPARAAGGTPPG